MSSIFRRGKTFRCRARRNGIEHRRSLKTTNRAVAERRFREWLDQLDKLAWGEKPEYTYAAAEEKFIREHLTTLKPRSAKRYGDSLKHLPGHFGAMTLAAITSSELSSFETKRRGDGVTPSTMRHAVSATSELPAPRNSSRSSTEQPRGGVGRRVPGSRLWRRLQSR